MKRCAKCGCAISTSREVVKAKLDFHSSCAPSRQITAAINRIRRDGHDGFPFDLYHAGVAVFEGETTTSAAAHWGLWN